MPTSTEIDLAALSVEDLRALADAIAAEMRWRDHALERPRCVRCRGIGKVENEYCCCALGRDLARVELGNGVFAHD